jgi:hypothetical protein
MRTIQVRVPGLFTTVQDLGREGFGAMGVSAAGTADPIALRLGNRLVGNSEGAASLEMTLLGGTFCFPEGAVVALTGSDFGATLDDEAIEMDVARGQAGANLANGPKPRRSALLPVCWRRSFSATVFGKRVYSCVERAGRVRGAGFAKWRCFASRRGKR